MRIKIIIFIALLSILTNGFLFYRISKTDDSKTNTQKNLKFLSKRLFVEDQNDMIINFIPLRKALNEYVGQFNRKVGVYFEYLPSGTSIGVNDKKEVRLASLSKVPIAMSIFKKIERGQMSLDDVLVIEKKNLDKNFGSLWKRGEGTHISIKELLWFTLTESDNTAYHTLIGQLTSEEINEVYENLDISLVQGTTGGEKHPHISPKNYSSVFRSLYLSSFLKEENSNYILSILTQTIFNDKMTASIPKDVLVAHKIGVFARQTDSLQDLFIDCGIVYVPNRPYILCAFVEDTNEQAQKHISYISRMIYEYMNIAPGGSR